RRGGQGRGRRRRARGDRTPVGVGRKPATDRPGGFQAARQGVLDAVHEGQDVVLISDSQRVVKGCSPSTYRTGVRMGGPREAVAPATVLSGRASSLLSSGIAASGSSGYEDTSANVRRAATRRRTRLGAPGTDTRRPAPTSDTTTLQATNGADHLDGEARKAALLASENERS